MVEGESIGVIGPVRADRQLKDFSERSRSIPGREMQSSGRPDRRLPS